MKKQFPKPVPLFKGMKKGEISCGASVIVNVRDSESGRAYCSDKFLSLDDDTSVYHYIRKVTHDKSYTKANLDIDKGSCEMIR